MRGKRLSVDIRNTRTAERLCYSFSSVWRNIHKHSCFQHKHKTCDRFVSCRLVKRYVYEFSCKTKSSSVVIALCFAVLCVLYFRFFFVLYHIFVARCNRIFSYWINAQLVGANYKKLFFRWTTASRFFFRCFFLLTFLRLTCRCGRDPRVDWTVILIQRPRRSTIQCIGGVRGCDYGRTSATLCCYYRWRRVLLWTCEKSKRTTMTSFTEGGLNKRLKELNSSQQSIQTLSLWLIHHRKYAHTVVKIWAKEIFTGKYVRSSN